MSTGTTTVTSYTISAPAGLRNVGPASRKASPRSRPFPRYRSCLLRQRSTYFRRRLQTVVQRRRPPGSSVMSTSPDFSTIVIDRQIGHVSSRCHPQHWDPRLCYPSLNTNVLSSSPVFSAMYRVVSLSLAGLNIGGSFTSSNVIVTSASARSRRTGQRPSLTVTTYFGRYVLPLLLAPTEPGGSKSNVFAAHLQLTRLRVDIELRVVSCLYVGRSPPSTSVVSANIE